MSYSRSTSVVSRVFDAVLRPESRPLALEAVTETVGAIGAAYGFSSSIDASAQRRRLKLSKCFPKSRLRSDEWYNDFVKAGVDDMLGVRLADHPSQTAILGIHYDTRHDTRRASAVARRAQLKEFFEVVSKAARLQYELEGLRWKSSLGLHALDQLTAGVIVTDCRRRLIEMNRAPEIILDGAMH
jgi:hypothetical protein